MKIRAFWNMTPCIVVNNYQNFGEVCYPALNYHEDEGNKLFQTLVTNLQSTRCHMTEAWNILLHRTLHWVLLASATKTQLEEN